MQRLTRFGEWVKIRRVILGSGSKKHFLLGLRKGRYSLRIFISMNEIGAGYQDGFSKTVVLRRKK